MPVTIGGKNRSRLAEERCDKERHDAADDDGAIDRHQTGHTATLGEPDRDHRRDGGERDALEQWQANTDFPEPDRLDDRSDPAGEEIGSDQVDQVRLSEMERAREQDRHDHRAGVEREHVLDSVDGKPARRQNLIDGMDRSGSFAVLDSCLGGHAPLLMSGIGMSGIGGAWCLVRCGSRAVPVDARCGCSGFRRLPGRTVTSRRPYGSSKT